MNDNQKYLNRIKFLLSLGRPITIQDLARQTTTSDDDVCNALEQLQESGVNIWTDGESVKINGRLTEKR